MYYFSQQTIVNSFQALKDAVYNSFLGVLGILHTIHEYPIVSNKTYEITDGDLSRWLDDKCYLKDFDGRYGNSALFIRFSNVWSEYVKESLIRTDISIFHLLVFLYKFHAFSEQPTRASLLKKFLEDYHVSQEIAFSWFNNDQINVSFSETPVSRGSLKIALSFQKPTISFSSSSGLESRPGELSRAPFVQTLYAGMDGIKCLMILKENLDNFYSSYNTNSGCGMISNLTKVESLQRIFYGAPGTGKSYMIDDLTDDDNSIRTTFHPDSDYASFVGAYKPTMEAVRISYVSDGNAKFAASSSEHNGKEKKIVYKYVPQAFLKAYVAAWTDQDKPFFLVIEEINRGNCAQIFGDLFQLLDRNNHGSSSYAIAANQDISQFLNEDENGFAGLNEEQRKAIFNFILVKDNGKEIAIGPDILNGSKLLLPPNLYIWATMNTSDQSLFPIDSAFKRRWDWKYVPIEYDKKNWTLDVNDAKYSWGSFLETINPIIYKLTESSDKQMGFFFAKADKKSDGNLAENDIVSTDLFVNKVLFYLWSDVLKDYDLSEPPFVWEDDKKQSHAFRFTDFFGENGKAMLARFMDGLAKLEDGKLKRLDTQADAEVGDVEGIEDNQQ